MARIEDLSDEELEQLLDEEFGLRGQIIVDLSIPKNSVLHLVSNQGIAATIKIGDDLSHVSWLSGQQIRTLNNGDLIGLLAKGSYNSSHGVCEDKKTIIFCGDHNFPEKHLYVHINEKIRDDITKFLKQ